MDRCNLEDGPCAGGYVTVSEAASVVRSLLRGEARRAGLVARAREVAKGFSYEAFRAGVVEAVEDIVRAKGLAR